MLTVATVLKSGGEYHPSHVVALKKRFERHLTIPFRFVCLSDVATPHYDVVPLKHDWPGWWSKIELFREDLFPGPVFYADLDTVPVRNMDSIVLGHRFTVLRNFWVAPTHSRIGSGLMAWSMNLSPLYEAFAANPLVAAEYTTKEAWGDQGFIQQWAWDCPRWQDVHPGKVVSWKMHCQEGIPQEASVICFHGQPRPWHTRLWREACL